MTADPQATDRCTSEPISWLALEQHALGELPPAASAAIVAHLRACPACQACAARISADSQRLDLPALPALAARVARRRWLWWIGGPAVAAAAVALVLLGRLPGPPRPAGTGVKGMAVSLTLLRERGGTIAEDPPGYLPGDRWQALVTCPAGPPLQWALLLFQNGAPAQRIAGGTGLTCGNRITLPGAFRLTDTGPASVCFLGVGAGDDLPPVDAVDHEGFGAACVRLAGEQR